MQITKAEVIPMELPVRRPVQMAGLPEIRRIRAVFVRIETRHGQTAWGCTVAHPALTGEQPTDVLHKCQEYAHIVPDLHPTNLEYSLTELENLGGRISPGALCAFDLAFHDLLCLAADMPLYRILGGYRNRIQTSVTVPLSPLDESVAVACERASLGFQILKIKGGLDPELDVQRVKAIHRALPQHRLRLDADGGYTPQAALDVARAVQDQLEMLEQPTPAGDLAALRQVTRLSPVPVLADQSLGGPASAFELATAHAANGLSLKLASCGGLRCARQIDSIARVARLATMVSCFIEPAMLIAAGLSFALSSPNVQYGDLDGHLDLLNDPSRACFRLEEGWLVVTDVPGLGYSVDLEA
jgi:L-alanine-DL-glutamate epimerase-like enolase superfamily enzyme